MTLLLIGFLGGLITGISPCVLPVLPVVLLSSRTGSETDEDQPRSRRPYLVVAGLVVSFIVITLPVTIALSSVPIPQDIIRCTGLTLLVLLGIGMISTHVETLIEKPFARIPSRAANPDRGSLLLGLALGAVYVPCAGPVLAAITVAGALGAWAGAHTRLGVRSRHRNSTAVLRFRGTTNH